MLLLLLSIEMTQVQWPDANFRDLERVEYVHGYGIRPLIRQVTANSAAKTFKGLTDINGFAIVVVKGIDAPLATTNSMATIVVAVEERLYLPANGRNIGRKANSFPLTCVWFSGRRRDFRFFLRFLVRHNLLPIHDSDSFGQAIQLPERIPHRQIQKEPG